MKIAFLLIYFLCIVMSTEIKSQNKNRLNSIKIPLLNNNNSENPLNNRFDSPGI